jgi:multicomponent Na+:H+ antiporter subunit C
MNKNLIKIVVGVNIVESSLILLLILISFKLGGTAPILDRKYELVVDPIPQALALTAIVIGGSFIAVMLALVIKIYKRYGTLNVDEIRKLRG